MRQVEEDIKMNCKKTEFGSMDCIELIQGKFY